MSIVARNQYGWILDHQHYLNQSYKDCTDRAMIQIHNSTLPSLQHQSIHYDVKEELFAIYRPYRMDSQFEKYAAAAKLKEQNKMDSQQISAESLTLKERKRKRKKTTNEEPMAWKEKEIIDGIHEAYLSLLTLGFERGHFCDPVTLPWNNNLIAREAAKLDFSTTALTVETMQTDAVITSITTNNKCMDIMAKSRHNYRIHELHHRLYRHTGNQPYLISCEGDSYLIPAQCAFYMSLAGDINTFIQSLGNSKFDMIVMDPPWENKSVKRKRKYYSLSDCDLLDIPVPHLANQGCLLVVWVTNTIRHLNYVKDVLFPHWSVAFLAEWHWLKVTLGGEAILRLDSDHKKPYETILLGRYRQLESHCTPLNPPPDPPASQLIVTIPCSIHSKKPPLQEVLKEYCREDAQCLELFARNLRPDWTSWGNEVLKHQNVQFFNRR